ncbi:SDR family NAD(P)-dependent oxidoreductase [Salmonirosea aquatica]|uniref:SDR family NAD(P)-dependent oxidoreductase n=1 Tax=Salmonirosea aquatica TaxID=2654236 RepID=A0A7C9BKF6_9BACT|nr:SDR family NAD(P)-dependent oxidoreductase [Cytophagaceae bacterium SJW1-29]
MARIFITGSADGLGQLAAQQLVSEGHQVVLHARNKARGQDAMNQVPGAETVLTADLSNTEETKQLAADVNTLGKFDAVIHNAGVYRAPGELIAAVNTLAPYILTSLIHPPKRLVYLTSGMHTGGQARLKQLSTDLSAISYSDSKLQVLMLSQAVARLWPNVYANAVNPGWVPTKMGGVGAPDSLEKGYRTQTWLATSDEAEALVSGRYFFHQKEKSFAPAASDVSLQEEILTVCEQLTGIHFPAELTK